MGFDRVVMRLINSSDMSAEVAAGTAPRTTYWPRGTIFVGGISPVGNKKATR